MTPCHRRRRAAHRGFASYDDTTGQPGETFWYWLEDVELNGAATLHGPVSATMQTPTAVTLATFGGKRWAINRSAGLDRSADVTGCLQAAHELATQPPAGRSRGRLMVCNAM